MVNRWIHIQKRDISIKTYAGLIFQGVPVKRFMQSPDAGPDLFACESKKFSRR
jgi:hypothetical protein